MLPSWRSTKSEQKIWVLVPTLPLNWHNTLGKLLNLWKNMHLHRNSVKIKERGLTEFLIWYSTNISIPTRLPKIL